MTLQASGPINLTQIDNEFGLGRKLGSYRNTSYLSPTTLKSDYNEGATANTTYWSCYDQNSNPYTPGTYNMAGTVDYGYIDYSNPQYDDQENFLGYPYVDRYFTDVSGLGPVLMHYTATRVPRYEDLNLTSLPSHNQIRYQVYWHFIDSLDKEYNQITLDGTVWAAFAKRYNEATPTFYSNIFPTASWVSASYCYAPWAQNYYYNGYIVFDTGWFNHTSSTFTASHFHGSDQAQTDEATYLSHVRVQTRTKATGLTFPSSPAPIKFGDFYGKQLLGGTVTFSSPGTYDFIPPARFNLLGVMIWGGGGTSGSHGSGGTIAGGGSGGWFYHVYTTSRSNLGDKETVVVGNGGSGGSYNGTPGDYSSFGGFAFARGGHSGGGVSYGTRQYSVDVSSYNVMRSGWTFQGQEQGGWGGWSIDGDYNGKNTYIAGGGGAAAMNDPYQSRRPNTSDFFGGKASALLGGVLYETPPTSITDGQLGLPSIFQSQGAGGYGAAGSALNGGGSPYSPDFRYGKFPGGGGGGADGVTGGGVTSPGSCGAVHIYWY